jgi:hypothetical protein
MNIVIEEKLRPFNGKFWMVFAVKVDEMVALSESRIGCSRS